MWMDIGTDGIVHIGVDAFLTAMVDSIERITFVTSQGAHRPTAVITVHGVDLQLVFPHPLRLTTPNLYLRSHPSTILTDPYTLGWLFEGSADGNDPDRDQESLRKGLVSGKSAAEWMHTEVQRVSALAHSLSSTRELAGTAAMGDGGTAQPGFTKFLTREELLQVFNEFFSPLAAWRQP
jgi:glycine cleavage system H lipoate-binding protein